MPVDEPSARLLAGLAAAIRVDRGLSQWDVAGVMRKIREVAHLELPDVAMAVIRAAANPDTRTPGAIPNRDSEHWRERVTDPMSVPRIPRADCCRDCGRHRVNPIHAPRGGNELLGTHPFVSIDAPKGTRPPNTLRQIVAEARTVCETAGDDVQHTSDTTEETP